MKTIRQSLLGLPLLWCFLQLTAIYCVGQEPTKVGDASSKLIKSEKIDPQVLRKELPQLVKTHKDLKALKQELTRQGFVAQSKAGNFWGITETYRSGPDTVTIRIHVQDYSKPDSGRTLMIFGSATAAESGGLQPIRSAADCRTVT